MECEKCAHTIKRHVTTYNIYEYCPNCFWNRVQQHEKCCNNPNINFVSHGHQLRQQCFNCWNVIGGALKKDQVSDFKALPILNTPKREEFYTKKWEEQTKFVKWANEKQKNIQHSEWLKQHNEYLQSNEWKEIRAKVLERDKYICQSCLMYQATQVHHLTYERWQDECAFDLISVCNECHDKIHSK